MLNRAFRLALDGRDEKGRDEVLDELYAPEVDESAEARQRLAQFVDRAARRGGDGGGAAG